MRMDKKHVNYRDNRQSFTGSARYLSVNAHMGIEKSRRDDIEAIVNILIYLMKGALPWQNLKAKGRGEKYDKILEMKLKTPVEVVC